MTEQPRVVLGAVENVDPRTIWRHEAHDLTPWVLENLQLLGDALGIEIQPTQREVPVGTFSLDVLGEDAGGHPVIVENQLESTDHSHLGQLLVYASGLEAAVIVWLTPKFRDEHRRALDWLNERTDEQVNFFGVELQLVRIGESPPAPLFRVVAQPNDWQKALKRPQGLTSAAQARHDFFELAMDALATRRPNIHRPKVGYDSWVPLASGPFGYYALSFSAGSRLRAEVYLDMTSPPQGAKEVFDTVAASHRSAFEDAFPEEEMSWERLDNKRASRIAVYRSAPDLSGGAELESAVEWAADRLDRLLSFDEVLRAAASTVKRARTP